MRPKLSPLPLQKPTLLFVILFITSIATSTSAGLYSKYPFVELRIDPPFFDQSILTMPMRRYRKRKDRVFGHIHFDNRRLINSISLLKGPLNTVCHLELGQGMGMEDFDFHRPFSGYAYTGFVTCKFRDSMWQIGY